MANKSSQLTGEVAVAFSRAIRWAESRDLAGFDAYDAMRSPVLRRLPNRLARRISTQAIKHSPEVLRRTLGLRPFVMTKTLALFATSYCAMARWRQRGRQLARQILNRSQPSGLWGYEFDVHVRWGSYPAGTPNIIVTAFAIEAIRDAGLLGALDPGRTLEQLNATLRHGERYVYVPGSREFIFNAHALGARTAWWLGASRSSVARSLDLLLEGQASDGSWPYGSRERIGWSDNFHTVYILDVLQSLAPDFPELDRPLRLGTEFWLDRFFDVNGRPNYYPDKLRPIDIHNISTAVSGLARLSRFHEACSDLVPQAMANLLSYQGADGAFRSNRLQVPYMRWNQAHAVKALADFLVWLRPSPLCDPSEQGGCSDEG